RARWENAPDPVTQKTPLRLRCCAEPLERHPAVLAVVLVEVHDFCAALPAVGDERRVTLRTPRLERSDSDGLNRAVTLGVGADGQERLAGFGSRQDPLERDSAVRAVGSKRVGQ